MKLNKTLLSNIALAALVACLIFFLHHKGTLKRLELASLDFSFRLRGATTYNPHIVIVEINDSDITEVGRWPWDRSWHAAMATTLTKLGAKIIYFDIIFSEASTEENDGLLEEALKKNKDVYFPFVFADTSFNIKNAFLPIKRFAPHLKGTGSINIYPDLDGTLRRIPLVFTTKDGPYYHVALNIAMDYAGLKIKEINSENILLSGSGKNTNIPLIEKNKMLVNFSGRWRNTFKHYSFLEVLAGYNDLLKNKKTCLNLDDFKNSICLVAVTAIGLYDIDPIPFEPQYPGIGLIANTISNILDKQFLYTPAEWILILIFFLLTLIPSFLITGEKPLRETLLVFLVAVIYFMAGYLLFRNNIWFDHSFPLLGLFSSYLSVETYNFFRVSTERQKFFKMSVTDGLTGLFNIRYFKMLLETEIQMTKTDPTKKFAIIMSDIDHFKNFNDTYGHQVGDLVIKEVANALKNTVRVSDIVSRYGGEEIIILLRGSSLRDGLNIAEKIRKNVESAVVKDQDNTYKVTISLGVSSFKPEDNVDTVIKRADDGLYQAKESGRNRTSSCERLD